MFDEDNERDGEAEGDAVCVVDMRDPVVVGVALFVVVRVRDDASDGVSVGDVLTEIELVAEGHQVVVSETVIVEKSDDVRVRVPKDADGETDAVDVAEEMKVVASHAQHTIDWPYSKTL